MTDGKIAYARRFEEPFKGPIIPFGAMVECHPISTRDLSRLHQFGKKVLPSIFLGYELVAGGIWEGDILIGDLGRFGTVGRIRYLPSKNQCEGNIDQTKNDQFIFPIADGPAQLAGRDHEFREPTLRRERTARSGDCSRELEGELGESPQTESTDDDEARADFWSTQGDFIYRHHNEPRVQLYVPKEDTFPILLKYIDVTRSTHTDLDVMQEKRIDDYWNVDANRSLSDSWKGITKFTLLKEKPPKGKMWSGEETDKSSND